MAKLISGEDVNLNLDSVAQQNQTLIRISSTLVMGVVNDLPDADLYLWQERNGKYVYVGDFLIKDQGASLAWKMVMSNFRQKSVRESNIESICKQADRMRFAQMESFHLEFLTSTVD
jgi:hypothetical protein